MATGGAGIFALDMRSPTFFSIVGDDDLLYFDYRRIDVLTAFGTIQSYIGNFYYEYDAGLDEYYLVDGYISEVQAHTALNGQIQDHLWTFRDLNISVYDWSGYVLSGDAAGLRELAFSGADLVTGGNFNDVLLGFAGNDRFIGYAGDDIIEGGAGIDTAVYAALRADYQIIKANGQFTVIGPQSSFDGTDALTGVEYLEFADTTVALTNIAPIVNVANLAPAKGASFIAAASLFTVTDPDDAGALKYRFFDGTAGNGRFQLNGNDAAELTNIEINASDLANFSYRVSTTGSGDVLWVQAYDGFEWGTWKSFTVAAPVNNAPIASVNQASLNPAKGTATIAASSLFSVTDADSDTITQYKFFDGTAGNGRFELNGVQQVELSNITVNAADLANFRFRLGGGSDVLWVQAFDGTSWSTWQSFTVQPPANIAPVASINTASLNPSKGTTTIAASSFFSATDGDGDTITQYKFFDGTAGNGHFELNGAQQIELANITVDAVDLANFRFRLGGGSDVLWVQAFDGTSWSTWQSFVVAAPANVAPTVNVQILNPAKTDTFIAGAALFTVTDPDDASMAKYRFFDGNAGNGRFQLNGIDQAELANIEIDAADLANFRYRTSTTGAGDLLWVQAFDGTAWGTWKSFMANAPVNVAPTVNVQTLSPAKADAFIAGSALFTVTDPDDASMTKYRFFDGNAGNGRFQLNGLDQAELANIEINAADLANFRYRTSTTGAGDLLWVQAFDGFAWGAWKSFMVSAPVNVAPVVNVQTINPSKATAFIAGANLFTVTDPDDSTITRLRFFDGNAGNGRFQFNGVDQVELANIEIAAADLANFRYRTSTTGAGDTLRVQVYDGFAWSSWKSFTANAPQNIAPVIAITGNLNPVKGAGFISVPSFFTVSDPDGDQITLLRFFDGTVGNGHFDFNFGTAQPELQNITIAVADMYKLNYVSSTNGSGDTLWVQAYDGTSWSSWTSFNVAAQFNLVPVVRAFDLFPWVGLNTIAGGALFTVDDDDAPVRYRFFDGTVGNGRFQLNGANQVENQNITVEAADLANFRFATSTTGSDVLWVQAYDGFVWSAWKSFTVAAQAGDQPSSGGGSGGIIITMPQPPAETFFETTSPTGETLVTSSYAPDVSAGSTTVQAGATAPVGDLIAIAVVFGAASFSTQWQFWDSTSGGGAFRVDGAVQAENQTISVMTEQLAAVEFLAGGAPGVDQLWVRAFNDAGWGAWEQFTITTLAG